MSSTIPTVLKIGDTQPTAALAPIPYCSPQAGELATAQNLAYNATAQALIIPLLTADPATSPAADTVMIYAVLSFGNYSIRLKNSAGTVKTTGTLS